MTHVKFSDNFNLRDPEDGEKRPYPNPRMNVIPCRLEEWLSRIVWAAEAAHRMANTPHIPIFMVFQEFLSWVRPNVGRRFLISPFP